MESLTGKIFLTSNTAASVVKGGMATVEVSKVEPGVPGKGQLKVTVTDALQVSTSITVDVIVHAGVAVDGWELVMKIKGAGCMLAGLCPGLLCCLLAVAGFVPFGWQRRPGLLCCLLAVAGFVPLVGSGGLWWW